MVQISMLNNSVCGLVIQHTSLEVPPDLLFFQQGNKKTTVTQSSASIPTSSSSVTVSPGKRVSLQSECINQLDKWDSILERDNDTRAVRRNAEGNFEGHI